MTLKMFYIHHLIRLKIINTSYRLNAGLGESTNGSSLQDSSGGSDRINDGRGEGSEGSSGDGDGFRSKKKWMGEAMSKL